MEAVDIQQKFKILFHNYSKCDNDMNSCHLFNEENIKSFGNFFINIGITEVVLYAQK